MAPTQLNTISHKNAPDTGATVVDDALCGTPITLDMLGPVAWTDPNPTADSYDWRVNTQEILDRVAFHLTKVAWDPNKKWLMCPSPADELILIGRLLRPKSQMTSTNSLNDHKDIARWIGRALAFAHENMEVDDYGNTTDNLQTPSAKFLYGMLNHLTRTVAAISWFDRQMPEWAQEKLGSVVNAVRAGERYLYLPWAEVQETFLTLLTAFEAHTEKEIWTSWPSNEAAQGILALRLLAGTTKDLVLDEIVDRVEWLEKQTLSPVFSNEYTLELRGLIQVGWDRTRLERVTLGSEAEEKTNEDPPPRSRRRIL